MKKNIILYLIIGLMFSFMACDPIEDRDVAGPIVPASQFKYSISQDADNDYILYLKNETPEVMFSWNYIWGTSRNQIDTVRMSAKGTYKIQITGTTAGGLSFSEYEVTVEDSDPTAFTEPEWDMLTNFKENNDGKTWVWDTDKDGLWGNGGFKGCLSPCWWVNNAAAMADRGVLNDEMTFDLNAGRNLTLVAASVPEPGTTKGSYNLDLTSTIPNWSVGLLTTQNVTIINGIDVNQGNSKYYQYHILKLTEDELHLSAAQTGTGDWGEAWFWMFKPKE